MPPKISVVDACFGESHQQGRGAAAQYLIWDLARNGVSESSINESDVILVTAVHPIQYRTVARLKKKYPLKLIFVGGPASTSPYTLGKYCDGVCVGDGQNFIRVLCNEGPDKAKVLPNVWIDGETRRVEVDQNFPWNMPPIQNESGAIQFWVGRGCKNKCTFCQTGWAYKYSENPDPKILLDRIRRVIASGSNKNISYCSNDPAQHTFFHDLPAASSGSYSLKYLKRTGLPATRTVRIGVEGVSERLRSSVHKPITNDDLVKCTAWLNVNHIAVRWFMIAGLPGEKESDWAELKDNIQYWKRITPKGTLGISFTAFCPDPATPLATTPISDDYYSCWESFKEWFFGGEGWSNRVKIMAPQMPKTRMEKAIASMGLSESELRKGGNPGPNSRIIYPYESACEKMRLKNG